MAKKSLIQSIDQKGLEGLSKDSLISLAEAGLEQAKQRQYRLKKSGYELGNYINTFNRKINLKRLRRDSLSELKSDIQYIHRYLLSENTSVSGRIAKGREVLTEISNKILEGNPKVTRIKSGFRVGDKTYSDTEMSEFFKKIRKLEESNAKWRLSKSTDYEVLSTVFTEYFENGITDISELSDIVDEKLKDINRDLPDIWNMLDDDEEYD